MPLVRDRCICLRRTEYSETSQIVTLFAKTHGIVRAIAKGAPRRTKAGASKFDGGVDLLDIGDAVFTHDPGRGLATLTEWSLHEGKLRERTHPHRMYLGLYAAELVGRLVEEHDPHPELFDRLENTLGDVQTARLEESFLAFELDLLRETGYLAELFNCASCGAPVGGRDPCYFSPSRGGVVCRNCEASVHDRIQLDARLLRLLQGMLRTTQRLPRLTRHQTDPVNRMLADQIEHTLGRALQMARWVIG